MSKPVLVVVGGGAGGLPLATLLGRKLGRSGRAEVVLVDGNVFHIWRPRFHEVATGAIDANLDAVDYRAHARDNGYRFELGRMSTVDVDAQEVHLAPLFDDGGREVLPARRIRYDYLVLAIGSQCNDFGTPGVLEHCLFMDSPQQAERFRERFLNACLQANYWERSLSIAIVGGGATGVELAAEIHHAVSMLKLYGHEQLDRSRLQVHVIEAAPRILPGLSERVSSAALKRLEALGVRVHVNTTVARAEENAFVTRDDRRIEADLLVWAAGVKAAEHLARIDGLTVNRVNQVEVEPNLRAKGQPRVFAIGDCANCIPEGAERAVPPRAQSAQQMAHQLARELARLVRHGREPRPFRYRDRGSLVSLSRFTSVGMLMGNLTGGSFFIEGGLARVMYISLYRMHQATLYGWPKTLLLMLAGKFSRMVRPRLKLH
ncbi:MAG TPA: NAD(P)/FAD-dependent oxidoreductase [Pseudomonadales bacterium]